MPKPVCIPCKREMQMSTLGAEIGFTAKVGNPPGKQSMYKVWACDIYTCPGCSAQVAARFSMSPSWERHNGQPAPSHDKLAAVVPE